MADELQQAEVTGRDRLRRLLILLVGLVLVALFWSKLRTTAIFFGTLGVLIYVHELGHFLAAKWAGVKVHEFALGFGPRLWTYLRRGGTDYTIRWLPLGGFVSMKGMDPEEDPGEDGLNGKSRFQRALVFAAGPLMNLLLAVVVLCSIRFVIGNESVKVGEVALRSEAARMGLKAGDVIVGFDGERVRDRMDLILRIQGSADRLVTLTVDRGGHRLDLSGTPRLSDQNGERVARLGFEPATIIGPRDDVITSAREGLADVGRYFRTLVLMVQRRVLFESMGGLVSIARVVDHVSRLPVFYYAHLIAELSLSLFIFNLLPIPILDGGHLLLLGVETVRRRKLRPEFLRAAQVVGLLVIGTIFLLVLYKDIVRHVP